MSKRQRLQNSSNKFYMYQIINERVFVHHYFRFLELEEEQVTNNGSSNSFDLTHSLIQLAGLIKKFNNYLRFVIEKYKTLNRPNYFDLNKSILSNNDLTCLIDNKLNTDSIDSYEALNADMLNALNQFDLILNNNLFSKLNMASAGANKQSNVLNLLNTFLDLIQLRLPNQWPADCALTAVHMSPLAAHYSSQTYLYEYVYEYACKLFEQFKAKRDAFQISEQLLLQLHENVLESKIDVQSVIQTNRFVNSIQHINPDRLFGKFEEYAECVHKYLPQIRHNNQYLLFHYIWTMQVQYMAPFFNYLCDFYSPID